MWRDVLFYTTLGYNLVRNKLDPSLAWYSRIDDNVLLGALPFKTMARQLIEEERVVGVVSLTEEHETRPDWAMAAKDWNDLGVHCLNLPTADFTASPRLDELMEAVTFIEQMTANGSVYVHCKAGKTRSVVLVACYLMQKNNWMANVAVDEIRLKRRQINLHRIHMTTINTYRRVLDRQLAASIPKIG